MDDIQQQAFLYGFSGTLSAGKRPALFAAESSDLLRSLDGKTWLPCLPIQAGASAGVTCLASEPLEGQTVLCGLAGGILVSRDGGQNWASARVPSPPPMLTSLVLSPNFLLDGVAMAGTMQDGVLRSSDQGSSWTIWNLGLLDL